MRGCNELSRELLRTPFNQRHWIFPIPNFLRNQLSDFMNSPSASSVAWIISFTFINELHELGHLRNTANKKNTTFLLFNIYVTGIDESGPLPISTVRLIGQKRFLKLFFYPEKFRGHWRYSGHFVTFISCPWIWKYLLTIVDSMNKGSEAKISRPLFWCNFFSYPLKMSHQLCTTSSRKHRL